MAKNYFNFILKRYRQPDYYREIFCDACAIYHSENGKQFMIEARPYMGSNGWGKEIDHYNILKQTDNGRILLHNNIKSQKQAMAIIERLLAKNTLQKEIKPIKATQLQLSFN